MVNPAAAQASDATSPDRQAYEEQLQQKKQQLSTLDSLLRTTRKQRSNLQAQIEDLSNRQNERAKRVSELQSELDTYKETVMKLEQQVAQQSALLQHDYKKLAALVRQKMAATQSGQTSRAVKTLFAGTDVMLAQRRAVLLSYIESAQKKRIHEIEIALQQVQHAREEALKSRNWLAHLSRKATSQQQQLSRVRDEKKVGVAAINAQEQQNIAQRNQLLGEQKEIQALLEELQKASSNTSGYFAGLQGKLPWPVDEESKVHMLAKFGEHRSGGTLKWNGILLQRSAGHTVSAIADGEVVYADTLAAMGIVVVIDHGDGFLSLYGGNSESRVKPGDWAQMGSTIATVGKIAGPNRESTYLEIRKNAVPVNPEQWLDAKKRVLMAGN